MKKTLSLLLLVTLASIIQVLGLSVTLTWDPNPESDIAGYRIYHGVASRDYTNTINLSLTTTNTVSGLTEGVTYFFAVTAYNTSGLESDFSNEVSFTTPSRPGAPGGLQLTPVREILRVNWSSKTNALGSVMPIAIVQMVDPDIPGPYSYTASLSTSNGATITKTIKSPLTRVEFAASKAIPLPFDASLRVFGFAFSPLITNKISFTR